MIAASISSIGIEAVTDAVLMQTVSNASVELDKADMTVTVGYVHKNISASSSLIDQCISASLAYIKNVKLYDYIKVDKDVLWVTPDVWEQLNVMSNVEWVIT